MNLAPMLDGISSGTVFSFVDTTCYPNERAANKRIIEINWRGVTPLLWDGEKWVDRLSAAIGEQDREGIHTVDTPGEPQ